MVPEGASVAGALAGSTSVFFGNVARDEDAVAAPTVNGAELFAVLRSRLSPEQVRYRVSLPAGGRLVTVPNGAEVVRGGQMLARVALPVARDAQGSTVPVTMSVSGDQLVLDVPHRDLDVAYPLIVDPMVDIVGQGTGWFDMPEDPGAWQDVEPGWTAGLAGDYGPYSESHEFAWANGGVTSDYQFSRIEWDGLQCQLPSPATTSDWGCGVGDASGSLYAGWLYGSAPPSTLVDSSPASSEGYFAPYTVLDLWCGNGTDVYSGAPASISVAAILITATVVTHGPPASVHYGQPNPAATGPGDPECKPNTIDCATGNQFESYTDLTASGVGPGLALTRTYNSQAAVTATSAGMFGYGWSSSYSDHLEIDSADDDATVVQGNGSTVEFSIDGSTITPMPWVKATLTEDTGAGTYTYTLPDQTSMVFSASNGRLVSESDRYGDTTSLTYNGSGELTTISEPGEHAISLYYNTDGTVDYAEDPGGNRVNYGYTDGNLTSVTSPVGATTSFGYDSSHQMTSKTLPNGGTVTTAYGTQNRVVSQTDAMGRTTTWDWSTPQTTVITKPNGSVIVDKFDTNDRLISSTDSAPVSLDAYADASTNDVPARGYGDPHSGEAGPLGGDPTHSTALGLDGASWLTATPAAITGTFTVEAWAKPANTNAMDVVGTRGPSDYSFDMGFSGGNTIHADIGNGTSWITTTADASYTYTPGHWYHLAYVVTPTAYTIYINGAEATSGSYSTDAPVLTDSGHQLAIGQSGQGDTYFDGAIADVAVYPTALSATSIADDYAATSQSAYDSLVLSGTRDVQAYYPLNDTGPTTGQAGPLTGDADNSKSVALNGAQSYAATAPMPSITGSFTVEAWAKPESVTASMDILSTRTPTDHGFDLYLTGGDAVKAEVGDGSSWITASATGTFSYTAGDWYHIACVVTPSGYTFYVDGSNVGSGTFTGGPVLTAPGHDLEIGQDGTGGQYWDGNLADVAVYPTALDSTDVDDDYAATTQSAYDALVHTASRDVEFYDPFNQAPGAAAQWQYTYDAYGNERSVTDPDAETTTYTYDSADNRTSTTDPLGRETQWVYNSTNDVTSMQDPTGLITIYTVIDGKLTEKSTPVSETDQTQATYYYYDDSSNPGAVTRVKDPNGHTTTYAYDSHGDLTSLTDADGNETTYTYDADGQRLSTTTPDGNISGADAAAHTTTDTYDAAGELTSVTAPQSPLDTTWPGHLDGSASLLTSYAGPVDLVEGPDGNVWATEEWVNQIARIKPGRDRERVFGV